MFSGINNTDGSQFQVLEQPKSGRNPVPSEGKVQRNDSQRPGGDRLRQLRKSFIFPAQKPFDYQGPPRGRIDVSKNFETVDAELLNKPGRGKPSLDPQVKTAAREFQKNGISLRKRAIEELASRLVEASDGYAQDRLQGLSFNPAAASGIRKAADAVFNVLKEFKTAEGAKKQNALKLLTRENFAAHKADIQDEIAETVWAQLQEKHERDHRGERFPITLDSIKHRLFDASSGILGDFAFKLDELNPSAPTIDKTTTSSKTLFEDTKSAFKSSAALFVQESDKLARKEPFFSKAGQQAPTVTARQLFDGLRAYVDECRARALRGEAVDAGVLSEIKSLLDKSFNPILGGVGRFPKSSAPGDKDALARFAGWKFENFKKGDLSANWDAFDVLDRQLKYYEENIGDAHHGYGRKCAENAVLSDIFAIQLDSTSGQLLNDVLLNNNLNQRERDNLLGKLKTSKTLPGEIADTANLQKKTRSNPLLMEFETGPVANSIAKRLGASFDGQTTSSKASKMALLEKALLYSPYCDQDTIRGVRGRNPKIRKDVLSEGTGRLKPLDNVMGMPDSGHDSGAQEKACQLTREGRGEALARAVTQDKIVAHGDRPIVGQSDTTLPPQFKELADAGLGKGDFKAKTIADCLGRYIHAQEEALDAAEHRKKEVELKIKGLEESLAPGQKKQLDDLKPTAKKWKLFLTFRKSSDPGTIRADYSLLTSQLSELTDSIEETKRDLNEAKDLQAACQVAATVPEPNGEALERLEGKLREDKRALAAQPPSDEQATKSLKAGIDLLTRKIAGFKTGQKILASLHDTDFRTVSVNDLQGRPHTLGKLSKVGTVSQRIHDFSHRTQCSISGTTCDILLARYAQYGRNSFGSWPKELLAVADGSMCPEDLSDEFRELFSSLCLFMQGGQYHTPAEVIGGMLLFADSIENRDTDANHDKMMGQLEVLLGHLKETPELLLITDLQSREKFTQGFLEVSAEIDQLRSEKVRSKKVDCLPPLSGNALSEEKRAREEEIQQIEKETLDAYFRGQAPGISQDALQVQGAEGIQPVKKEDIERLPYYREAFENGDRGRAPSPREIQAKKQAQLRVAAKNLDQLILSQPVVSRGIPRAEQEERAVLATRNKRTMEEIVADFARVDKSINKDGIDVLKNVASSMPTVEKFETGHNEEFLNATAHDFSTALGEASNLLGCAKYLYALPKAQAKTKALSATLDKAEAIVSQADSLKESLEAARANREKRKARLGQLKAKILEQRVDQERLERLEQADFLAAEEIGKNKSSGQLTSELSGKNQTHRECQEAVHENLNNIGETQRKSHTAHLEVAGLYDEINAKQAEINNLPNEIQNSRKLLHLRRELEVLKNRIASKDTECKTLTQQLETLRSQTAPLEQAAAEAGKSVLQTGIALQHALQGELEAALKANAGAERIVALLEKTLDSLQPSLVNLKQTIRELRYKISENAPKIWLRYPVGAVASAGSALSIIWSVFKNWALGFGLVAFISAVSSTVRTVRANRERTRLNEQLEQLEKTKRSILALRNETKAKFKAAHDGEPSEEEINADRVHQSTLRLLEASRRGLEQEKRDAKFDMLGESLCAVSGYANVIGAILLLSGVGAPLGIALIAAANITLGLIGGGILLGSGIVRRRRAEKQQTKLNEMQSGFADIQGGKLPEEVARGGNRQIARLVKKYPYDPARLLHEVRNYVDTRYNDMHAEVTVSALENELDQLAILKQGERLPSPSQDPDGQLAGKYLDDRSVKKFPTLYALRQVLGADGISKIHYAGGRADCALTLLKLSGARSFQRDHTQSADAYQQEPASEAGMNPGLIGGSLSFPHSLRDGGMASAAVALRGHAGVLKGHMDKELCTRLGSMQTGLITGFQSAALIKSMKETVSNQGIQPGKLAAREPLTALNAVFQNTAMAQRVFDLGRPAATFGTPSLTGPAQQQLRRLMPEQQNSGLPLFVNYRRFDKEGQAETNEHGWPGGSVRSENQTTTYEPTAIICNRGATRDRGKFVTYERIGDQWYQHSGGQRLSVSIDKETVEHMIQHGNHAEREFYYKVRRDLTRNVEMQVFGKAPNR